MTEQELYLMTLRNRRDYLALRVEAKRKMGWEYEYDQREREALTWAIEQIERAE